MKKTIPVTVACTLAAVILGFALNPSADKHREKIKQAVAERSQLQSVFGVGHLKAFTSEYKSLGVASYTTIDGELTCVGLLGFVFVLE